MGSLEMDLADRMNCVLALERRAREEEMEKSILGPLAVIIYEKNAGRHMIVVKDEETKKTVEKYLDAVANAMLDGDGSYLIPYTGVEIEDSDGKKHLLESDLNGIWKSLDEICGPIESGAGA